MKKKYIAAAVLLFAAVVILCLALSRPGVKGSGVVVRVDGREPLSAVLSPEKQDDLRVVLTLDGRLIADLPFGEAHTIQVLQENGDENTLLITGNSVRMESANCEGQDCVHMEEITRDNLETRVMFGMIICLPHRLSVEVK